MEGIAATGVRDRTDNGKSRFLVEQVIADNKCGAPSPMFLFQPHSLTALQLHNLTASQPHSLLPFSGSPEPDKIEHERIGERELIQLADPPRDAGMTRLHIRTQ